MDEPGNTDLTHWRLGNTLPILPSSSLYIHLLQHLLNTYKEDFRKKCKWLIFFKCYPKLSLGQSSLDKRPGLVLTTMDASPVPGMETLLKGQMKE